MKRILYITLFIFTLTITLNQEVNASVKEQVYHTNGLHLNLRESPNLTSKIRASVPSGTILDAVSTTGSWDKILYKGSYVYAYDLYLKPVTTPSLRGDVVILDPGHGGIDTGAVKNGLSEKNITLDVSKRLKTKLESKGAKVYLTRSTDTYSTPESRAAFARKVSADIFVSIHVNSNPATYVNGLETYYNDIVYKNAVNPYPKHSKSLAVDIQNATVPTTKLKNDGIKEDEFIVLRNNSIPSVLVELGFISNSKDSTLLKSASFRDHSALGISNGISNYFGSH